MFFRLFLSPLTFYLPSTHVPYPHLSHLPSFLPFLSFFLTLGAIHLPLSITPLPHPFPSSLYPSFSLSYNCTCLSQSLPLIPHLSPSCHFRLPTLTFTYLPLSPSPTPSCSSCPQHPSTSPPPEPPLPALTFPFQFPYGTHASVIGGSFKGRFIRAAAYLLPSGGNWEAVRWVMAASSPTRDLPITSQRLPPTYRFAFSLHPFPFIAWPPLCSAPLDLLSVFHFPPASHVYLSYAFL